MRLTLCMLFLMTLSGSLVIAQEKAAPEGTVWRRVTFRWTQRVDQRIDWNNVITAPEVIAAPAKEKLGMTVEEARRCTRAIIESENGPVIALGCTLPPTDRRLASAPAYLDAVAARLPEVIRRATVEMELAPAQAALRDADEEAERAQVQIAELRTAFRKATGRVDVSPESLRAAISLLDGERQKLALESSGTAVRQKMIEEAIAKLSDRAAKSAQTDAVAEQLQAVVNARAQEVERLQTLARAGSAAASEVSAAQAQLAEAKARLLERRSNVSLTIGGDALASLNRDLLTLSIQSAEADARRQYVVASLDRLASIADQIDTLETLLSRRAGLLKRVDEAHAQLLALRRSAASIPLPMLEKVKQEAEH